MDSETGLASLHQYPVAALSKTIALEYPELHCTHIDLDQAGVASEISFPGYTPHKCERCRCCGSGSRYSSNHSMMRPSEPICVGGKRANLPANSFPKSSSSPRIFSDSINALNKYLSTQVLISDAVWQQLGNGFVTRQLGEFRVAGKKQSVVIHELLCRCDAESDEKSWIEIFEKGLTVFRAGEFKAARDYMGRTRELRGGSDGPSEFYLQKITQLEASGHLENWTGIVELSEK